ncbi:MAG: AMP-binding protein, partial [Micromonosporaceae bacterium]
HQSAVNTILDVNERFAVTAEDRVLAVSEFTFDLSVYDVFGLLAAGGAVVVPDHDQAREVTHLHDMAVRHRVTVWNSVPAYLGMFVDFIRSGGRRLLDTLRLALVSGDWVPVTLARELAEVAPAARCVSLGGATEASIWSNYFPVPARPPSEWVSIPYGYPLRNQRFRVLDRRLADRPDWVPGELHIAGRGLADGYLGAPEQTDRAFVTCPDTGERLYRTGDWGRYWPDGVLEFLGREDPQVKINGFRVELGEVESTLLGHPAVGDAVVVTRRSARGLSLVGFVVAGRHPGRPDEPDRDLRDELDAHLRAELPGYMVPATIELRAQLPLTPNGKVDRGALVAEAAELRAPAPATAAPRTDTERHLARLWAGALGVETVGVRDDFFDTGGTSLTAAQLMNGLEQEFGVRLPLAALYTNATVESLARRLDESSGGQDGSSGRHGRCLVPLARHGRPPVVLVHPVGGDLLCYRPLVSALADRYDVFGVQAVPETAATSVTELAREYLREVRGAIPAGPYRIVGWSLGGVVAHAMGELLVADGQDCSVVMIDPWLAPSEGAAATESALVSAFLSNLTGGEPVEGVPDGADPLIDAWSRLRRERPDIAALDTDELVRRYRTFAGNTRALLAHTVSTAPGLTPVVIEASEGLPGTAGQYLAPWRVAAASAPARYLRVAGDHFAVLDPAVSRRIATLVAEAFSG